MKLSLGFSSCPNDTFIFDALVHKKIDTKGIDFEYTIADVQELNNRASNTQFDITKLSYFAYAHVSNWYQILDSGSALGYANGPLFICKKGESTNINKSSRIILPGSQTTAHLLFCMAYPEYANKQFAIFYDIEQAILNSTADAGVIIHENRFTYAERGFESICDLGTFWEQRTGLPIPLGNIAVRRTLPDSVKQTINELIKQSIQFAMQNPHESYRFITENAQELSDEVKQKHIALFVNNYSIDLGITGKQAITRLFEEASKFKLIPLLHSDIFLNP